MQNMIAPFYRTLFKTELRLLYGGGNSILVNILFMLSFMLLVSFAAEGNLANFRLIGPAMIWVALLLTLLQTLQAMFEADKQDGTWSLYQMSGQSMGVIILVKFASWWVAHIIPLILALPFFVLFMGLTGYQLLVTSIAVLLASPALIALGGFGSALASCSSGLGRLMPILVLPLCLPLFVLGIMLVRSLETNPASFWPLVSLLAALSIGALTAAFMGCYNLLK
jgi:heme exporter protein B